MRHAKKLIFTMIALLLLLPVSAWAKPKVEINISAEKEIVVEENGQQVTKRVPAEEVVSGEIVIYTITYTNSGDEQATNVSIVDPVPAGANYIPGSATETGDLTFSIDQGKSYKKPSLLSYEVTNSDGSKEQKVASPEEYTHVRWVIPVIAAGEKGSVSLQVLMK